MRITAKFSTRCAGCRGNIFAGEQIEWGKSIFGVSNSRHVRCSEGTPATHVLERPEPERERDMRAIYESFCYVCGARIKVDASIHYSKSEGARHTGCDRPEIPADAVRLAVGSGYTADGFAGFTPRTVIRNDGDGISSGQPEFLYVLTARARYIASDGMSFGVGDERGYIYEATCRPAGDDEAAPLRGQLAREERVAAARSELSRIAQEIEQSGEPGRGPDTGEIISAGACTAIHIAEDEIYTSVRVYDAGTYYRRVPFDAALAARIRACAAASVPT